MQRSLAAEWLLYENAVIRQRREIHPELRAEAMEAFIGGMHCMFRIFTAEISQIHSREEQGKAVNDLQDQIRALALQAGRK